MRKEIKTRERKAIVDNKERHSGDSIGISHLFCLEREREKKEREREERERKKGREREREREGGE